MREIRLRYRFQVVVVGVFGVGEFVGYIDAMLNYSVISMMFSKLGVQFRSLINLMGMYISSSTH